MVVAEKLRLITGKFHSSRVQPRDLIDFVMSVQMCAERGQSLALEGFSHGVVDLKDTQLMMELPFAESSRPESIQVLDLGQNCTALSRLKEG